uniref:gamma-interferon-responsive lysosomal thiol protein-like isoform X1 n=1 Tax=Erigeron canadensis TaxID=72917 RepID=UPI001CB962FE|nr:gamma-interferon-responsive lysosomal thiol protein-like isoform X1 [Erigeron canadensis]
MASSYKMLILFFILTMAKSYCVKEKVSVALYYEALCPYCSDFIVNQLGKALFQDNLVSIVDLKMVPWGNTQLAPNNAWICQHGPDECSIDVAEACAIELLPQQGQGFKLIECIENLNLEGRHNEWKSCMGLLKVNPKPIMDCHQTKQGFDLELKFAEETNQLKPPHRFVPWVLVNNNPLQEDYPNFAAYVCKAYNGQNRPKACEQHVLEANSVKERNSSVCYRGENRHSSIPFNYNF